MIGTYVQPVRTTVSSDTLRIALRNKLLSNVGKTPSEHALTTLVAMSAFETGHWKSCWNYNLGNVKAGETWSGLYTCLSNVREVLKGVEKWFSPEGELSGKDGTVIGQRWSVPPGHPQTRFRAYATLEQGLDGWVAKMTTTYRVSLEKLLAGADTDTFIKSLKGQSYFSGDLEGYQDQVRRLYMQYGGKPGDSVPMSSVGVSDGEPMWYLVASAALAAALVVWRKHK
jgi:hypothetical protein